MEEGFAERNLSCKISDTSMEVTSISLMKSERIKGVLTYTEIYNREL